MSDLHHDEDDFYAVWNALVCMTGYDSFAEHDLELYYGCDYEHHVDDGMVQELSEETGLQTWYVRNILLDDVPEVRAMNGKWAQQLGNGRWIEFADYDIKNT